MNKNLVNYPIRFGTLLLAGASLAACSKTTFTETDAFRLETNRLRVARQIDSLSRVQAQTDRVALLNWQNAVDQLEKANAGGKVFYTVIPVRGTDAVFATGGPTQGGRTENAVATAVVTVTQFGRVSTVGMTSMPSGNGGGPIVVSPTPGNNVNHSQNGVFTFGDLRSGEITVNITAPNHTEVNYVANLTPDGGVPNNSTIYVGNVVPLFEISGTAANMATIRGNVYYEGDLTNDREEPLRTEIFNPTSGTPATNNQTAIVTAAIDVTRNDGSVSGLPYFHQRFLAESNGEGVNSFGVPVRSGAIQRIAYSAAPGTTGVGRGNLTNVASDQSSGLEVGAYSMLVPSTAGGLPIQLRFAEFAAYRTYYNNRGQLVPNRADRVVVGGPRPERFLYGPTVVPTDIPVGASRPFISVQAFTTQAAATVVFTPEVPGVYTDNFTPRNGNGTDAQVRIFGGGVYLTAPTVTVTGTNTSAASFTAATVIVPAATLPLAPNSTVAGYVASVGAQPTVAQLGGSDWAHLTVTGINVGNGGAGYAANDTRLPLNFTRTDVIDLIGFGGQFTPTGTTGSGLVALNPFAQVVDGGAGFIRTAPVLNGISSGATFTNYLPTPIFTESDQPNSADPTRGYNTPGIVITPASARVFVDYNATYNVINVPVAGTPAGIGVTGVAAITGGVGAIQEVSFTSNGAYPAGSLPFINFSFGETVSASGFISGSNKNLFVASATQSVVQFNTTLTAPEISGLFTGSGGATISANAIDFSTTNGWGSRYTFVPTVQITPNSSAAAKLGATTTSNVQSVPVICFVDNDPASTRFGKILRIQLTSTPINGLTFGAGFTAGTDFLTQNTGTPAFSTTAGTDVFGLNVIPSRYGNTLRVLGRVGGGQTQSTGTGINSYSYNNNRPAPATTSTFFAGLNTGAAFADLATRAGGITSNTQASSGRNDVPVLGTVSGVLGGTIDQIGLLFGNETLVAFSAPTAAAVGNAFAWGVPLLNNGGNPTGNTLLGARILNPGSGYNSPVVSAGNFTSNTTATLVPNPWFRGNRVTLSGNGFNNVAINGPADIAQANGPLGLTGAAALLPGDIVGFLGAIANASGDIRRTQTAATAAFLDFTITAPGSGYAQAPDAIVFGGGLDLTTFPATGGGLLTSAFLGGTRVNSAGVLTRIAGAPVAGGAAGGRFTFPLGGAPAYTVPVTTTTPLFVRIIDRLSETMTRETNDPVGLGGVGATAIITPITGTPQSGEISAVTFGRTPTGEPGTLTTTDAYSAAARITQGTATVGTGNAFVPASLPVYFDPAFVGAPANTVASGTALIEVDPASPRHREIYAINVGATTRGSGYSLGNRWQRLDTGNSVHRTSQPFSVFGGFEGGGINGIYNGHLNQDNIRFDAFTGMTYTRDAHYGTGRLLD